MEDKTKKKPINIARYQQGVYFKVIDFVVEEGKNTFYVNHLSEYTGSSTPYPSFDEAVDAFGKIKS